MQHLCIRWNRKSALDFCQNVCITLSTSISLVFSFPAGWTKCSVRILDAINAPWLCCHGEASSVMSLTKASGDGAPPQPDISLLLCELVCVSPPVKWAGENRPPVILETPASVFQLLMSCLAAACTAFWTHRCIHRRRSHMLHGNACVQQKSLRWKVWSCIQVLPFMAIEGYFFWRSSFLFFTSIFPSLFHYSIPPSSPLSVSIVLRQ